MHKSTLQLPTFAYRFKTLGGKPAIFDVFRRKYVLLSPEEWVRQHLLHHLVQNLGFPVSAIGVEKGLEVDELKKRYDALVYDANYKPFLLIECKAVDVPIDQAVFDQVARYNRSVQVPFILLSNGVEHIMAEVDHLKGCYTFAEGIPEYAQLLARWKTLRS